MTKHRFAIPVEESTADSNPFSDGRAAGRAAYAGLLKTAPLKTHQIEWLSGFLQGLVETTHNGYGPNRSSPTMTTPTLVAESPQDHQSNTPSLTPFTARITNVESFDISDEEEWLDVTLDVEGGHLQYRPGSTLALWPTNDPEEVRKVLRALDVSAQLAVRTDRGVEPAWQVLLERVNISATFQQTIEILAEYSRSESEADSLRGLSEMGTPPSKPLLSLLRRFPSARPPLEQLLDTLVQLEPSLVPIASSSLDQTNILSFSARVVDRPGTWGEIGTATRTKFCTGEWLAVSIDNRHAPMLAEDDLMPAVVIADGPCIAFARALVAERHAHQAKGRNWVIGVGMKTTAFPYSRELAVWHKAGSIGRYDVSVGTDPSDAVRALDATEDTLWRWLVDHSQIFVVSTRDELRRTVAEWLISVIVRRQKVDTVTATQKLGELRENRQFVEIPG